MNYYDKNRTSSYLYRKIYEEHYGKIPVDADGRTYDIHHIDGNSENNDPSNLVALSINEHYEVHKEQGDSKACLALLARMKTSPAEQKQIASDANSGEKNPSYGSKWWNNGVTEIRTKNPPIGDEWQLGRFGIKEKINKTKIKNNNHPAGKNNPRFDHRVHKFINASTGEIVMSTQYEFIKTRNLNRRGINRLVDGTRKTYKEWSIEK